MHVLCVNVVDLQKVVVFKRLLTSQECGLCSIVNSLGLYSCQVAKSQ